MSSLPKQHSPAPSSASSKQPAFRADSISSTAPSRPRPIGKRQGADYTQSADDGSSLPTDVTAPEAPSEPTAVATDETDNPSQPASTFKPFFTLVQDANSSDYHHPTVHYIFSDDDPELITEASLRVLETGQVSPLAQSMPHGGGGTLKGGRGSEDALEARTQESSSLHRRPSLLPPPLPGVTERFILLDVEPTATFGGGGPSSGPDALAGTSAGTGTTMMSSSPAQKQPPQQTATTTGATPFGYRIASAHSLTSDWQVLDASFSPAPTFDTPQQQDATDQANISNTLMLRIEGTAGFPHDIPLPGAKDKDGTAREQTLEEMMEQFDRRMSELRRVIETNADYAPGTATAVATDQPGGLDDNNERDDDNDTRSSAVKENQEETQDSGEVAAAP